MRRIAVVLLLAAACDTKTEEVCENVGDCAHGGSADWVEQCKAAGGALETESKSSGCGDLFDGYYDCAKDRLSCSAGVATFPGCDRAALDDCLTKARNGTACADLGSHCGNGGLGTCNASQSCKTRCYLDIVRNACAPTPEELDGVAACSASCV